MKLLALCGTAILLAGCATMTGGTLGTPGASRVIAPAGLPVVAITAEMESAAQQAVRDNLKDPDSAQFKQLRASRDATGNIIVCGQVNAKNSYGGFVGFGAFYALISPRDGKYLPVDATTEGTSYVDRTVFAKLFPACT